jgi:5-methylcytosine-specific restriction protein A
MAIRVGKPCRQPGCPRIVKRGGYCVEHTGPRDAGAYDRERGSSAARGYGGKWQRIRKIKMKRNPICEDPYGIHEQENIVVMGDMVDHIIPLKLGGSNKLTNLQTLCYSCHNKKTAEEQREGVKGLKS